MKNCTRRLVILGLLLMAFPASSQTVTFNEATTVVATPKRIGINLDGPSNYGAGEIYKNYFYRNSGFEPSFWNQIFVASAAGTTTTFKYEDDFGAQTAGFWNGGTFQIVQGAAAGCSGTISNSTFTTAVNTITFSSACSAASAIGDVIRLRIVQSPTPESDWESNANGTWGNISGGGKLTSDTADLCSGCGSQALTIDSSASGASASFISYTEAGANDVYMTVNGTYQIDFDAKSVSGALGALSVSLSRAATNGFSCTYHPTITTAWAHYTGTCTASEIACSATVSTGCIQPGMINGTWTVATGAKAYLDNVSFQKISGQDSTNTSVFRDELVAALRTHYSNTSGGGAGILRGWFGQNGEETANTIKPLNQRMIAKTGHNSITDGQVSIGLGEFLKLASVVGAEPWWSVPGTTSNTDAANLVEYLNGSTGTTYGGLRNTYGQSATWTSVFPNIHLELGNENWNFSEIGQGLGYRPSASTYYFDYSTRAGSVFGSMKANASWNSSLDLVIGLQDGNPGNDVQGAIQRSGATTAALAPYTQNNVADVSDRTLMWRIALTEPIDNAFNTASTFNQQVNAIKPFANASVYEFDNSTTSSAIDSSFTNQAGTTQSVVDGFSDGAGYGTLTVLQALLNEQVLGVTNQSFFALSEYCFGSVNGTCVHAWGAFLDIGGATNGKRPQEVAMEVVNPAIIGAMYSCPVSSPTTYNLAANHNGYDYNGVPAKSNVANEYAFCFKSGSNRSMVLINNDVSTAHPVIFSGTNVPTGNVIKTQYAPSSINAVNETTGDQAYNLAPQVVVSPTPTTLTSGLGTQTLPAFSVTRFDWTVGTPSFTGFTGSGSLTGAGSIVIR
jgi:hypothetical protein